MGHLLSWVVVNVKLRSEYCFQILVVCALVGCSSNKPESSDLIAHVPALQQLDAGLQLLGTTESFEFVVRSQNIRTDILDQYESSCDCLTVFIARPSAADSGECTLRCEISAEHAYAGHYMFDINLYSSRDASAILPLQIRVRFIEELPAWTALIPRNRQ